jgi:hypothetical protein
MEAIKWKVSCENTKFQVKNAHMGLNTTTSGHFPHVTSSEEIGKVSLN